MVVNETGVPLRVAVSPLMWGHSARGLARWLLGWSWWGVENNPPGAVRPGYRPRFYGCLRLGPITIVGLPYVRREGQS